MTCDTVPVNPILDGQKTVSFTMRPRVSLLHKILLLTVLMTVLPTFICVSWLNSLTRSAMNQHHSRNVQMLATAMAQQMALEGHLPESKTISSRLTAYNLDQRLSFVIVSSSKNRLHYRQAIHAHEWMNYQRWMDAMGGSLVIPISQPVVLGDYGELAVARVPIWHHPVLTQKLQSGTSQKKGPRQLLGYLTIAVSDRTLPQTLSYLRSIQISAALLVCIVILPVVLLMVRSLTKPLTQVIDASISMAQGKYPVLDDVHRNDEIGLLNKSFNLMLNRLKAHQGIQDRLHEHLESKVEQRTHELESLNNQLARTVKQFESLASTDSLTGLANRREIGKTLDRCFIKAKHYHYDLACIMLDMDGFKLINDTLGHQMGDEVLCSTAKALAISCRNTDVAGRYGGDEFVVVLPQADEETAISVAIRIREQFEKQMQILLHHHKELLPKVTLSMGVAIKSSIELADSELMLAKADDALYRAKNSGKDRIVIYSLDDVDNNRTTEIVSTRILP
ncbi:MAG: diguanylate cyclase [Phycisphaeraceae bacterium]|nr:diguanylate cyclase [Phycisphaeraceae bacterium]